MAEKFVRKDCKYKKYVSENYLKERQQINVQVTR